MSQPMSASARIQHLEAENKRLRLAAGENDTDSGMERQITELEREILIHQQILSKLRQELAALRARTGHYTDPTPESSDRDFIREHNEHRDRLRNASLGRW